MAEFQRLARAAIADCRDRGVVPVVVGGSALYIRAIVDEFEFPGTDPAVRAGSSGSWRRSGRSRCTPGWPPSTRARRPDPAAERATDRPGAGGQRDHRAAVHRTLPQHRYVLPDVVQIGLDIDRPRLHERIAARVDAMWAAGLVDEVRRLAADGLRDGLTASRALGYRQVLAFLDGEITEEEAYAQTVTATRRFARRQDSWFRRDPRIRWLDHDRPDLVHRRASVAASRIAPECQTEARAQVVVQQGAWHPERFRVVAGPRGDAGRRTGRGPVPV